MAENSSGKPSPRKVAKPQKPYPKYPMYSHRLGYWSAKIGGKIRHFGRWGRIKNGVLTQIGYEDGWRDALATYNSQINDLQAGQNNAGTVVQPQVPNENADLTIGSLCNKFLNAKLRKLNSGELVSRTFSEYKQSTARIVSAFGKDRRVDELTAGDFEALRAEIAKNWGPVRLGNEITRIRGVFGYAYQNGLIDRPVRYGSEFKKPGKSVLRRHKAANRNHMLEPATLRKLLEAAEPQMRALLLLSLNCGFGNSDCSNLQKSSIDLANHWIDYPRPKTGIERRCKLWPETVRALQEAIEIRPEAKVENDTDCVFLSPTGQRWVKPLGGTRTDKVARKFADLMKAVLPKTDRVGFYSMRHIFRTIADGARDQPAIDLCMGHSRPGMSSVYVERIDDSRLEAVSNHVRAWLFSDNKETPDDDQTHPATLSIASESAPANPDDTQALLKLYVG